VLVHHRREQVARHTELVGSSFDPRQDVSGDGELLGSARVDLLIDTRITRIVWVDEINFRLV